MVVKKTIQKTEKQICNQCIKPKNLLDFYMTKDTFFFPSSRIPVCKDCLFKRWEEEGYDAFVDTMRIINKPIDDEHFKSVEANFRSYIKDANSLTQFRDKTFLDTTLFEHTKTNLSNKAIKLTELSPEELKEAQDFWGIGFEESEYLWLTTEYIDYIVRYGMEESKTLEDTISEICLTRLDIRNRRRDNKDVDKQIKTLNDLMTSAGIKPIQESMASSSDQDTYGMWIKKLENERPISDPKPEWADVDGIRKYIVTFFLHPWARLFNKDRESPYYKEAIDEIEKFTVKSRYEERDDD